MYWMEFASRLSHAVTLCAWLMLARGSARSHWCCKADGSFAFTSAELRAWCSQPKLAITHHKTGTEMMSMALPVLNAQIDTSCHGLAAEKIGASFVGIDFEKPVGTPASHDKLKPLYVQAARPAAGTLVVHVRRHPVETSVSSYNYDLENQEWGWQNMTCPPSDKCDEILGNVANSSQSGVLASAGLPAFNFSAESWIEYLSALPEDEGLMADAVHMQKSLDNMVKVILTQGPWGPGTGRLGICERDFVNGELEDCEMAWRRVVKVFGFPPATVSSLAARVANTSCTQAEAGQKAQETHGTVDHANKTKASDQVVRLKQLDHAYLGGQLAKMTPVVACPLSERYAPPTPAVMRTSHANTLLPTTEIA